MTPIRALTTDRAAAVRLRRMAPWLILLAIGVLLMVPGILFELGHDPSQGRRPLTTVPTAPAMVADAVPSPGRMVPRESWREPGAARRSAAPTAQSGRPSIR